MEVGDLIKIKSYPGEIFEVLLVNLTRVHVQSNLRMKVAGLAYNPKTGKKDKPFAFEAPAREMDIGPGTEATVIGNTGRKPQPKTLVGSFIVPATI